MQKTAQLLILWIRFYQYAFVVGLEIRLNGEVMVIDSIHCMVRVYALSF